MSDQQAQEEPFSASWPSTSAPSSSHSSRWQRDFFHKALYDRLASGCTPISLYNSAKSEYTLFNHVSGLKFSTFSSLDNKYLLQRLTLERSLNVHSGCVNTICWNNNGQCILSGSDDVHLCVTNAFTQEVKVKLKTGHVTNIFSAKYLPGTGDEKIVSCSGDGVIIHTDLNRPETTYKNIFDCHEESVYDVATVPHDPNTFLSCSHDTTVRWYDLRVKSCCTRGPRARFSVYHAFGNGGHASPGKCVKDVLIKCDTSVTAIAVNQMMPSQLAIGCSDSIVRVYDRRWLTTNALGGGGGGSSRLAGQLHRDQQSVLAKFTYDGVKSANRITSLAYDRSCQRLLASYSNDNLYLFDLCVSFSVVVLVFVSWSFIPFLLPFDRMSRRLSSLAVMRMCLWTRELNRAPPSVSVCAVIGPTRDRVPGPWMSEPIKWLEAMHQVQATPPPPLPTTTRPPGKKLHPLLLQLIRDLGILARELAPVIVSVILPIVCWT